MSHVHQTYVCLPGLRTGNLVLFARWNTLSRTGNWNALCRTGNFIVSVHNLPSVLHFVQRPALRVHQKSQNSASTTLRTVCQQYSHEVPAKTKQSPTTMLPLPTRNDRDNDLVRQIKLSTNPRASPCQLLNPIGPTLQLRAPCHLRSQAPAYLSPSQSLQNPPPPTGRFALAPVSVRNRRSVVPRAAPNAKPP